MEVKTNEINYLDDMIEEIDEMKQVVSFKTSKLINIIRSFFNQPGENMILDYNNFGKNHNIPEIICKNTKVNNYLIHIEIFYRDTKLRLTPVIIHFIDLKRKTTTYLIHNKRFVDKIKTTLNFKNPVIIENKKEYSYEKLENFIDSFCQEFIIEEKKIIDFADIFNNKKEIDNSFGVKIKTGLDLAKNFKYYFKHPDPNDEFQFITSAERDSIFSYKNENKIMGICGPMGIGKSTTLLGLLKLNSKYCYLNIKALKEAEEHILVWRDQLLLLEIAYFMSLNSDYKKFSTLQNNINKISNFWDAIVNIINFFVENKIKINLIFDQYKEKIDPYNKYIKKIKEILEKDVKNNVSIILSSSINDKDVRNSLLSQWIKAGSNNIFSYTYFLKLIDITNVIENDPNLTEVKKNMIINDFNSIPKFYYAIRNLKTEKELNTYKDLQMNKIRKSLNDFFSEPDNILVGKKIELLINLRSSFGNNLKKDNFNELLTILPFKYFMFNLKKCIVEFTFSLVKDVFDDFLSNEICKFIKSPIPKLKEGTIGDILELNLENDLINNYFCKFDQITKVNSIWDISEIKYVRVLEERKSILILQSNNEAKYVDFAIISDQENLLLYQCKKALKSIPKNPITKNMVQESSNYLNKKYEKYFKINIKKIFLFYVTGITFFMKDNKLEYRTWGGNEKEDFKTIKNLADIAKSELFFYDVIKRKMYYENNSEFSEIGDIIEHAKQFSSPVLIYPEKNINNDIFKKKQEITIEKYNDLENSLDRIVFKDDIKFFSPIKKAYLDKNYPKISKNGIEYYMIKPKYEFLNQKRIIGLKKDDQTYILINKKKIIKQDDNKKKTKSKKNIETKVEKGGKNTENKEVIYEENEKKCEIKKEEKEEQPEKALFLLNDNSLKKVDKINVNFYDNLDYAAIFKDNISLEELNIP